MVVPSTWPSVNPSLPKVGRLSAAMMPVFTDVRVFVALSRVKRDGRSLGVVGENCRPLPPLPREANWPVVGFCRQKVAGEVEDGLVVVLDDVEVDVVEEEVVIVLDMLKLVVEVEVVPDDVVVVL